MNYFSRLPWVHLLFPESTVMRVRRQFRDDGARHYEDVEGGLNRMSVRRFERLVDASGCTIESLGYGCVMGINLVCKLPLMRELLVNTIFCELTDTVADA